MGPHLISELANSARLSNLSVWRVLRDTLPDMIGKTHTSSLLGAIAARRTPLNTAALDQFDPGYAFPDWAQAPGGLPPGKFDQVSGLLHMIQVQDRLFQDGARQVVNPLMSQPLIELCLRLPVYLLSRRGVRAFLHGILNILRGNILITGVHSREWKSVKFSPKT